LNAYISSSLAILGNQKRVKVRKINTESVGPIFTKYDNTGKISKAV